MKMERISFPTFKRKNSLVSYYKVLVVDDYRPARQLVAASLATLPQIGEIEYASSGEDALAKVASKQYDLIFLDVNMPGLDGFETCGRIRALKGYEITPIIMVTGNKEPSNEFKGYLAGCTSYVNKPIQQQAFRNLNLKMLSWLEGYKAAA